MSKLFKDLYNEAFFHLLTEALNKTLPDFNRLKFLEDIYDAEWEQRELKQRMRHIAASLKKHFASDYSQGAKQLLALVAHFRNEQINDKGLELMFIPDFVEQYGLEHYHESVSALEQITMLTSCEFAVRPFIIRYEKEMIEQMQLWAKHRSWQVRRLASEGCRPRLPWAMALPALKENPSAIIPILEELKNDPSEIVRRSVANNLNDISKDNPALVIKLAKEWKGLSKETDWLIKHACRTLLKAGNKEVMQLFGFGSIEQFQLEHFEIETPSVKIGDSLTFSFCLINQSAHEQKIRLEYGIYYQKANGTLSRKVFKISEKLYARQSETQVKRQHSFRLITTRRFYPGTHMLSLIINGNEVDERSFELTE